MIELFRSLYFVIPVWVAFELRYLTLTQLTTIEVIFFSSALFLELPTGALADLLGKRPTIVLGSLISAIGLIIFGHATTFTHFIIYALVLGLGWALISGAREALLYDTLKQVGKEKSFDKLNSRLNVVFQSGLAMATFLGGYLGSIYFRLPMYINALALFIGGIGSMFLIEPKIDTEKFTLSNYIKQTKIGFGELFKSTYITKLSIFYGFIGGITWTTAIVFSNILLIDLGYSSIQLGITLSSIRVINSLVLLLLLVRTKFFTQRRVFQTFAIFLPLVLLPGLIVGKLSVLPVIGLTMLLSSARHVLLNKYTNKVFSSRNRATAISALSMFVGIVYITVMALSGPIMERWGGPKIMFTLLGVVSMVVVLPLGLNLARNHSSTQAK